MSQSDNKLYEFGEYRLDLSDRLLWRGEEVLTLPPKVFDTLSILVKREGRIVSKSELMEAIWSDAFVEESNLSQNIYTLRRTLGVDETGRQFIETVPRRGYRFAVPVRLLETVPNQDAKESILHDTTAVIHTGELPGETSATNASPPRTYVKAESPVAHRNTHQLFSRHYSLLTVLALLVLAAVGFGAYRLFNRRNINDEATVAPIEQVRFERLTNSGDVIFPTISPNGELLAYVRHEADGESIWVKQIASGSAVQTLPSSPKGYQSLAFTPDGKYLFFRESADRAAIYQTPVFGGALKKVADNVWGGFSISPDGKQVAFVRREPRRNACLLILSNVDGSGEMELSARQLPLDYRGTAPAWSPDGSSLIVAGGVQEQFLPKLIVIDRATGKESELKTPRWRSITRVLWRGDGRHLIIAARAANEATSQLWMLSYPDGEVRRLTNDLEAYFWISLSADGRRLVTRQQRIISHIWLVTGSDVKNARQLTLGERNLDGYVGLAWTPQGRIIFSLFAGKNTDLYAMDQDGRNGVQLTVNAGQDNTDPVVSNNGRYVVFTSNRTGASQIWRMDVDGQNQKQLTFGEQKERAHSAALSPDGREVFFIKLGNGPAAIWKTSVEGGPPLQVSRLTNASTENFLAISPDGKWLAYRHLAAQPEAADDEERTKIGVIPTDGKAEPKLFELQMRRPMVQWAADSKAFYFADGRFNASILWKQSLDGSEPEKISEFTDRIFNLAWSRDEKHLVVSRGRQQGDAILVTNLP